MITSILLSGVGGIEMKRTGVNVGDMITKLQQKKLEGATFPYRGFVCRCGNCRYSSQGKCALKECCCMDERIRAHTCTLAEMMKYCFSGVENSTFHFRLQRIIDRANKFQSCFIDAGHRKRFYEGLSHTRRASNRLVAQIFLLSAHKELWDEVRKVLETDGIVYSALDISIRDIDIDPYPLVATALNLAYGSLYSNMEDLTDDEFVDVELFQVICYAVAISIYGVDVIKISEKQKEANKRRKGRRSNG